MTPLAYAKWGGIAAAVIGLSFFWYHQGGLSSKAALEASLAAQSQLTATAVLAERASAQAQALTDHAAETTHATDIAAIDALTPITTPLLVYRYAPATASGAVPGAPAQAGASATDPAKGSGQPVDRGSDIRPAIEALKTRLEIIMADYRQQDAEWPKP